MAYFKQYRIENKEKISVYKKQYDIENKEKISVYTKQYRIENRKEISEHKKQYYIENKEEISERHKQYHSRNREEILEQQKQYYNENKEEILAHNKLRYKDNLAHSMLMHAQKRAKTRGIPFNITEEYLRSIWPLSNCCPYLGTAFITASGGANNTSPSLDKITPDLGYVIGNVQIVSNFYNRMKQNSTPEQLKKFCEKTLNFIHYKTTIPELLDYSI